MDDIPMVDFNGYNCIDTLSILKQQTNKLFMKNYLILLVLSFIGCSDSGNSVNYSLEAEVKRLDSLTDMVKQTTAVSIENNKMMLLRLKETYAVAWWKGAQAVSKHPNTLEIAFLADSLKFAIIVDKVFHNPNQ